MTPNWIVISMKIWVLTIPASEVTKRVLLRILRLRTKRWQFGFEVGHHTGYEHYHVRYECSNNDYAREREIWRGIKCELQEGGGWSSYELKDGNFYTSMDDSLGRYRFGRLENLQHCILTHGRKQSDRRITCVCDKHGSTGKTFLARWMCLNGKGTYIDGSGRACDIIADVYDISESRCLGAVFIDLTRNANQNRSDLWSSIEQIKNGYLKDSRYQHREKWISPPEIYVFCNREPKWENLSADRWDKIFLNKRETKKGPCIEMWDRNEKGEPRTRNFYRNN